MIQEEIIQRVKDENDIVDIISENVKLKRAGRNYIGLCPFHNEKTPSFSVSPDKQIYKCFGCGEAGNVITFIMKTKKMTFVEAVKELARKVNITIEEGKNERKSDNLKKKIYNINVEAARYFFYNLRKNKKAIQYLNARGILNKSINKFGIGFASDSWHSLIKHLKSKNYTDLDLIEAGLAKKSDKGSIYDSFRNRIIFPVFDYRGRVIGFGGRVLDDSKPKYLNSRETRVFKKGINLYGLNFAIKNQNNNRTFIIVEGYMDCISLQQFGITNVVASLGTALTVHQAKLLKRFADKVIISYDADIAGQAATLRGLDILKGQNLDVRIITIPKGKDPDEFIRANGKKAFEKLIEDALPYIDYRIKKALEGMDLNSSDSISKYIKDFIKIIENLNPVEKDVYIKKVSNKLGIKEQAIYDMLNNNIDNNVKHLQNMNIMQDLGQKLYLEPAYIKAERNLLKLMYVNKKYYQYIIENIDEKDFILDTHKKIYDLIVNNLDKNIQKTESTIEVLCDDIESSKEWIKIKELTNNIKDIDIIKESIDDYIKEIKKFKLEESKKEIMHKIKEFEDKGMLGESVKLAQSLIEINKEINSL